MTINALAALAQTLVLLASPVVAQVREIPDPALTPGVVASTDEAEVCGYVGGLSYSKRHRVTTEAEKRADFARYGIPYPAEAQRDDWEDDHRCPIALGCADDPRNRWPEPSVRLGVVWGRELKDRLEAYLWRQVCKHHAMPLTDAQAVFLAPDWREGYCAAFSRDPLCSRSSTPH